MIKPSNARVVTSLSAVCVLGVVCLGFFCTSGPPAPTGEARGPNAAPALQLSALPVTGSDRIACTSAVPSARQRTPVAESATSAARVTAGCETEAQYRARFLAIAAHEEGGLEKIARGVLLGNGPDCEKVAVLRALCDSRSPHAVDFLASAVADLPDVSGPEGESVPRCALRFLANRAGRDAQVRAALARLVWSGDKQIAADLRASAAATVAFVASGTEAWRIVRCLQLEHDPLVHAAAVEALSRNRDPDATSAFGSLGAELAVEIARDD